jgi:hypothetical protein
MTLHLATPDTQPVPRFSALAGAVYIDGRPVTQVEACELIAHWAAEASNGDAESRLAPLFHKSAMELWRALRQARLQLAEKRSRQGWAEQARAAR